MGGGRVPKPSSSRRNRPSASRAALYEIEPDEVEIPELPPMRLIERKRKYRDEDGVLQTEVRLEERPWSVMCREWWQDVWSSPMASEFHRRSDKHGLYRLAVLIDGFWSSPSADRNFEIRLA